MSAVLPRPETTLALIFGASKWPDCRRFEPLPAVEASSDAIYELLRGSGGLELPLRNIKNLFGSFENAAEQLGQASSFVIRRKQELSEQGSRATDLVIYYAGHGDFEGEAHDFYLTVRRTSADHPMLTSITARELGNWVRLNAYDLRTYLMIDCCFAAAIQYGFMTSPLSLAELKLHEALPASGQHLPLDGMASAGVALLAAAGLNTPAIASPDETLTRFTAALLGALGAGHPHLPDYLSLSDLHSLLSARLDAAYPHGTRPELRSLQQTHGRVELVGLFPNAARVREKAEQERVKKALAEAEQAKRERQAEKERVERQTRDAAEQQHQLAEQENVRQPARAIAEQKEFQLNHRKARDARVKRRGTFRRAREAEKIEKLAEQRKPEEAEAKTAEQEAEDISVTPTNDSPVPVSEKLHGANPPKVNRIKHIRSLFILPGVVGTVAISLLALSQVWIRSRGSDIPGTKIETHYDTVTDSLAFGAVRKLLDFQTYGSEQIWKMNTCDSTTEFRLQMKNQRIFWWQMSNLLPEETIITLRGNNFYTKDVNGVGVSYQFIDYSNASQTLRRTVDGSATVDLLRCS